MATFKLVLRRSTRDHTHASSLCVRIIHSHRVKVLTAPISLYPDKWDATQQQILLPVPDSERYPYLNKSTVMLGNYWREFEEAVEHLDRFGRF